MVGHYRVVQVVCLYPLIVGDKKAENVIQEHTEFQEKTQ